MIESIALQGGVPEAGQVRHGIQIAIKAVIHRQHFPVSTLHGVPWAYSRSTD